MYIDAYYPKNVNDKIIWTYCWNENRLTTMQNVSTS